MTKIAVLGGGVNGLGSAIKIKEAFPNFEVTVYTKDVTPNTTGDGSAGLWTPYILGDTPQEKIKAWSSETFEFCHQLWLEGLAGACLIPLLDFQTSADATEPPSWSHIPYGYRNLSQKELQLYNQHMKQSYKSGVHYVTYTCEPTLLLPYLMERFTTAGGRIVQQEVESLQSFVENGHDAIINCTGLASKYLVPDERMFPTRGQVARIDAPWMKDVIFVDEKTYIIPNSKTVVLGGTGQKHDYNKKISSTDSKKIFNGCHVAVPGLKNAPALYEWTGLRPSRDNCTRLERSDIKTSLNKNVIVIHNYGHGGSGVTLFWGCATDVLHILTQALSEKTLSKL